MRRGLVEGEVGWGVLFVSGEDVLLCGGIGAYYWLLVGLSPWDWHERGFVEPWVLIDECLHEDFDAFKTGAQWSDHRDDLLLAAHRSCESIKRQTI